MISAFQRMTQSILAVLGEDALFDGVVPCKINIENDVQFAGMDHHTQSSGDLTLVKDVATISNEVNPTPGKVFQMLDKASGLPTGPKYRLDRYVDTNGYSKRYIVLKVT